MREDIHLALFNRLSSVAQFKRKERRLPDQQIAAGDQPALFVPIQTETHEANDGILTKRTFRFTAYLYVHAGNGRDATPAAILNPLLDAVEAVLAPDWPDDGRCTLGGLVHDASIDGQIETDEGLAGPQGFALIPIKIILP